MVPGRRHSPASAAAIAALLALIAAFLLSVEIFTRQRIVWMSRVEAREESEYRAAITPGPANDRKMVLLMGNSLMGDGVRFDDVQAARHAPVVCRWGTL
jgi:hypothetical protein